VFSRVSLTLVVMALLCTGAFTLGGAAAKGQGDMAGIPAEHPVALAYRFRQELGLSGEQQAKLEQMRATMAIEFAPYRSDAEAIQHRMQELQSSGKASPEAGEKLKKEGDALGAKMQALFERYGQGLFAILTPEQRGKLGQLTEAHSHNSGGHDFVLMFIVQSREQLGIDPQQFTKLLYMQADFIRAFAPVREQAEMLGMEIQEKFQKEGKEPPAEYRQRMGDLQKKIMEMQGKFSEQAVREVLRPEQRAKLGELLHGEHRPEQSGG
jgi:Spy/CpxP family protein refolding chaperone